MRYNIIENIELKDGKAIVDIIRKNKNQKCTRNKQDMTELLQANGEIGFYMLTIKEVLTGAVTFSDDGNKIVKKLKNITDNLLIDEKYKEKKEKINEILRNVFRFQDSNKMRTMYEKQLDEAYDNLNNYISIKIKEEIYLELPNRTNQNGEKQMDINFYKELLDELLEVNQINDITEEQKEIFFKKFDLLIKDVLHYYELTLNSQNQSGIIFLQEKYPNNFILSELLDSKIKYIDLRMKEYEDRYWGLCSVFTAFYEIDDVDMKQKIEEMTDKERRSKFVEKNYKQIEECEEKYLKLVDEYRQKHYEKQENEM